MARYCSTLPKFKHIAYDGARSKLAKPKSFTWREAEAKKRQLWLAAQKAGFRAPVRLWRRTKDLVLLFLQFAVLLRGVALIVRLVDELSRGGHVVNQFDAMKAAATLIAPAVGEHAALMRNNEIYEILLGKSVIVNALRLNEWVDFTLEATLSVVLGSGCLLALLAGIEAWRRLFLVECVVVGLWMPKLFVVEFLSTFVVAHDESFFIGERWVLLVFVSCAIYFQMKRFLNEAHPFSTHIAIEKPKFV